MTSAAFVPPRPALVGVFVGGASRRMGSPKGLLELRGEPLVLRLVRLARALGPRASEVVLVGERPEYAALGLPTLRDGGARGQRASVGPLGGLVSLLEHAGPRWALALSCDLPFVSLELLAALLDAPDAAVVAPVRDGRFEPLVARYDAARVLATAWSRLERGERSLQGLLAEVSASPFVWTRPDELDDWDTPDDVRRAEAQGRLG